VEAQPPVTVEQRRLSNDERIQSQVMDRIAGARNISGKIGVESYNAVVTLTGYTTTTAQADRASRYAGGVMGVKYVQNEIRSRMGGSI
jgi:osmotically-inducible protein OsmY